jgi:hypothetical protein
MLERVAVIAEVGMTRLRLVHRTVVRVPAIRVIARFPVGVLLPVTAPASALADSAGGRCTGLPVSPWLWVPPILTTGWLHWT